MKLKRFEKRHMGTIGSEMNSRQAETKKHSMQQSLRNSRALFEIILEKSKLHFMKNSARGCQLQIKSFKW